MTDGAPLPWDDLVTCALLGSARRPTAGGPLPGELGRVAAALSPADPAARLLDTAALMTTYRRAGARAGPGEFTLSASPEELVRASPPAAATRLGDLLHRGDELGTTLLRAWLQAAADAGVVAPPEHLPALLDRAGRSRALAADVAAVLGERGRWLAAHRPDWAARFPATGGVSGVAFDAPDADPQVLALDARWTHGSPEQRQHWFASLRHLHPAAARAVLASTPWRKETPANRTAFLTALQDHLSVADEELLERARSDSRQDIRAQAADILACLPGSAFSQAAASRAAECLQLERRRLRRTLVVVLAPAAAGDDSSLGTFAGSRIPSSAAGPRARVLAQLLAATPLSRWERTFDASAADLVALPVSDDLRDVVHGGWATAAQRQHDQAWASALLRHVPLDRAPALLSVLAPAERVAEVIAALDDGRLDPAGPVGPWLQTCDAPWAPELGAAVVRWLRSRSSTSPSGHYRELFSVAALALPCDHATVSALRETAQLVPEDSTWRPAFTALADTVRSRLSMLEELR